MEIVELVMVVCMPSHPVRQKLQTQNGFLSVWKKNPATLVDKLD
jgi:hypothetical protein